MRATRPFTLALAGATLFFAAACSSGEAGDSAAADEAEMAAEPVTSSASTQMQELACFVRGDAEGRPSPLEEVEFTLSGDPALLCYGAPSSRDREVMGALVPFDSPWRMGANEATALHVSFPATIGGVAVEPGSYSLYAMPGESEWMIHVNQNAERWGIPVNDDVMAADVGTFTVPAASTESMVETLTYSFEPHEEGMGHIVMEWENTRVEIPVHHAGAM